MSLINDALRRASQADRNRPSQAALPRPMLPADAGRNAQISWVLPGIVAVALALAGLFFWKWWEASHPIVAANPALAPASALKVVAAPAPPPAPAAVARETTPPPPTPVATPAAKPGEATQAILSYDRMTAATAPANAKPAEAIPTAASVEAAWPTELTLKGIFYSKANPRALINGKTVGPGESVGGVLVARIEMDRVIVEWNGQTKNLMLDGQ
ncbi:MAG: hypothetical protein ABSH38_11270 [Verrucomicrobiota bacterium]|jgi:hypothetical protein